MTPDVKARVELGLGFRRSVRVGARGGVRFVAVPACMVPACPSAVKVTLGSDAGSVDLFPPGMQPRRDSPLHQASRLRSASAWAAACARSDRRRSTSAALSPVASSTPRFLSSARSSGARARFSLERSASSSNGSVAGIRQSLSSEPSSSSSPSFSSHFRSVER
eukprot:scaffold106482_cov66-Phaeocystis_antarctica.AAC.4